MEKVKKIFSPEIAQLRKEIKYSLQSNVFLLNMVMNYLVRQKGKMMRPYFALIMAKIFGEVNRSTILGAVSIELLHTATLIHDDVVDESDKRRGLFSIPKIWKNKISVLGGDYMLSKGLLILLDNSEYEILKSISKATKKMSEGELLQLQKKKFSSITEKDYLKIVEYKTASLFASCFEIGAYSILKNHSKTKKMNDLGTFTGIAFQIKDDLLDFSSSKTGKPASQDLKDKKITLPLIYALEQSTYIEKRKVKSLIRKKEKSDDTIAFIKEFCKDKGGIEYTENVMKEYYEKALDISHSFPKSEARKHLIDLISYTIKREK